MSGAAVKVASTGQGGGGAKAESDPGLRFWLRYVEAEGALVEDQHDQALVLLPDVLQERLGLAEVITVTADPEVSREEGALLLTSGHPLLDATAGRVLDSGDAGTAWLAWPHTPPPTTAVLTRWARESVGVEHGRVDRHLEAAEVYAPVLRVGGLTTTTASLELRFQERSEVWVDALTGLELSLAARDSLAAWSSGEGPAGRRRVLTPALPRALALAHRLLEQRATERAQVLAQQAAGMQADALAQVDAYYDAALASIERRLEGADDERRALLAAQAEATLHERERRRREVNESYRASYELRPFRLHLVLVPAMRLPLLVRRGAGSYPLELTWLLPVGEFAPVACPSCGEPAPLVAGRQRLGCEACMPRLAVAQPLGASCQAPQESAGDEVGVEGRAETAARPGSAPLSSRTDERRAARQDTRPRSQPSPQARRPALSTPPPARRVREIGDRLSLRFWQEVAEQKRSYRKRIAEDSPLRAAYRLWGVDAPLVAVGVPPGRWPSAVRAFTREPPPGLPCATIGELEVGRRSYPFTLRWELRGGRPVVVEVLPSHAHGSALPPRYLLEDDVADRLFGPAPVPRGLDPVAAALWSVERRSGGLPLVLRCLAAWWRVGDAAPTSADPQALAAAVASLVASRSGIRRTRAEGAADHGADPAATAALARTLQRALRLTSERPW